MHVLAVIAGLLLLIFAGGCTIWSVSDGHFSSSRAGALGADVRCHLRGTAGLRRLEAVQITA